MSGYPDDADGAVLARLAEHGVDMSQPLLIEFASAAPDEPTAQAIEADLIQQGYEAHVEFDEGEPLEDEITDVEDVEDEDVEDEEEFGPLWTVFVEFTMIPDYDEIIRIQADLDRFASPHGGHSDGWGVLLDADEEE